jgi:hypothetical protein
MSVESAKTDENNNMDSDARNNTNPTSTTTTTTTYEQYIALVKRALSKSRQSLVDTKTLIKVGYDDDDEKIKSFGGSQMLEGILDGLLDNIANETIVNDLQKYCTRYTKDGQTTTTTTTTTIQQQLDYIDHIIHIVTEWEQKQEEMEKLDSINTQKVLDKALLPKDVTSEDVVTYREYQKKLDMKQKLKQQLEQIEKETQQMEEKQNQQTTQLQKQLDQVHNVERELETAANTCAMVTN